MREFELVVRIHPIRDCMILLVIFIGLVVAEKIFPLIGMIHSYIGSMGIVACCVMLLFIVLRSLQYTIESNSAMNHHLLACYRRLASRYARKCVVLTPDPALSHPANSRPI